MNFKKCLLLFVLVFAIGVADSNGQDKTINHDSQTWLQYFLNARLTNKLSMNFDAGYRRNNEFFYKPLQWLARGGVNYHVNNDIVLSVGYAYFSLHTETKKAIFDRSEHRPWARYSISQKYGKLQLQHRYRLEWRNIQKNNTEGTVEGYNSYLRSGYQLNLQFVLRGDKITKGTPYIIAYNEILINFGDIVLSYYDQNRMYIGLGYGVSKTTNVTFGYQYIYSQQNLSTFSNINSVRLNIIQNLDFRKQKEETKSILNED